MERIDKPKVMDISKAKRPVSSVVPSRQLLVEDKPTDEKPSDAEPTDRQLLTDKHQVVKPVTLDVGTQTEAEPAEPTEPEVAPPIEPAPLELTPTEDTGSVPTAQPGSDTEKAIVEAAKANAREQKIEQYIDSRQFYVPVERTARKKSVRMSGLLTVLVLLLACVLIDLMLDSGAILLVQKIPHTHFFGNLGPNKE